jgi:hypothetical protein
MITLKKFLKLNLKSRNLAIIGIIAIGSAVALRSLDSSRIDARNLSNKSSDSKATSRSGKFDQQITSRHQGFSRLRVRDSSKASSNTVDKLLGKIALAKPASPERVGVVSQLAVYFATNDPDAGFEWLKSMKSSDSERSLAASVFAQHLAMMMPSRWSEMTSSLPSGPLLDSFIGAGLAGIAKEDAKAAWLMLRDLKLNTSNAQATEERVLNAMASSNSMGLWRILQEEPTEISALGFTATKFFASARFEHERDAVLLLSESIGSDDMVENYLAYTSRLSHDRIPDFADAIIDSKFDQEFKDKALADLLDRSFWKTPLDAARITNQIGDQKLRSEMADQLLNYAIGKDPELAEEVRGILNSPN